MDSTLAGIGIVVVGGLGLGLTWSLRKQAETLGQIHVLVNSRLTEALDDISALKKALVEERRHTAKGRK
jgi:hypothetical protein